MNRHPFRWSGLAFGLLFLSIVGTWAVWEQDLLTQRQFSLTLSAVLIVFGTLGVVATFWRPTPRPLHTTPPAETPEDSHEAPDPQP